MLAAVSISIIFSFPYVGFEYWSDPSNPNDGYLTWQVNGQTTTTLGAPAMAPDTGPTGSGVGQRLIPVEPMSIILNLGISRAWLSLLLGHRIPHRFQPPSLV